MMGKPKNPPGAGPEGSESEPEPGEAGSVPGVPDLYRLLVETVSDYAIFALDKTGHILTWNRGAQKIKGYTANEIIGRHFSVFYPLHDVEAGKPNWELMVAEAEGRLEDEGWRLRRDGTRFWASVIITALPDPNGDLVGFAKVTRDLTERRRAEETLRQSEQRFRLMVEAVHDYGIFVLDTQGRVVSWNEGAERVQGYTANEIIGRSISTFYPSELRNSDQPRRALEIAASNGRFEEEGWRVRKDGTYFWANVIVTPIRNDKGKLTGFAKVTRDLTERRAAHERAIADATRIAEVEAANRAKSEFLTTMSHELRTPLNAIAGYLDLLMLEIPGPITDQQLEAMRRIQRSQRHLLAIINDLLNFSRIEAGQVHFDIGPVPIDHAITSVRAMVEPQAATKNIEIEWPAPQPDLVVRADAAKLEQILLNLLGNAIKFTAREGRITISFAAEDDQIHVQVRDTGIGIPPEKLDAIFEPFVQVGRSLSSGHEGTGLGLAISRDLARAMDGDLRVASILGEGATFTLSLPAESSL
jgi:PAS domain S-box-containing protein